jgi:hypothetical protein
MGLEIFNVKELAAINALAALGGQAIASQVGSKTGLSARIVGQTFRHNEIYVRTLGMVAQKGRNHGHEVKLYGLTNEGWALVRRKRGKKR